MAVLLVICDHFAVTVWKTTVGADGWWLHTPIFRYGWSGVDLFFVLSGFFIGGQLWRERIRTGTIRFRRFFARRAMRIWPLYFVTLMLLALGLGGYRPRLADWLLVSNYVGTPYARSWSLSTEEMFYLIVPVLVLMLPKVRVRYIAAGLVLLVIMVDVNRMLAFHELAAQGVDSVQIATSLYSPFHLHNEGLVVGLLIALVASFAPRWVAAKQSHTPSAVGLAVLLGATAAAAMCRLRGGQAFSFTSLALIYGGLTFFLLRDRSALSAPFRWRGFFPLSRLSYGMYLNHLAFMGGLVGVAIEAMSNWGMSTGVVFATGLLVAIAVSIMLATLTFMVVEHPALLLRDRLLRRRTMPTQGALFPVQGGIS
jgi:peptidoglycan/LPS O-acetylase OafA/YrhL